MSSTLYSSDRGSGPSTLVLLHGFGASHAVWNDVVAEFSRTTRTMAYDLPGHGGSLAFPDAGPPKLAARAIAADLAERGIDRAHVVGHSMGGAIAVLIGLMAPDRIASLTLLAPGGFGPEINGPLLRRYGAAVEASEIRGCLAAMSGPQATVSDTSLGAYRQMRVQHGQADKLGEIAALITKGERQGEIPREMLATLAMPVSVLWGDADPVLPVSQAQGLPASFKVRILPGAGHMLMGEAPAEVAALIHAQLAGRSAH
ncbi:MAG: alpha/beta fold hydrolase [Mesorhizobium sp.]|nr:alpha/beta fold hydrolase [Mesorhizobium sp.]